MADITHCRLYLEGQDDVHSIYHLLKRHNIDLERLDSARQFLQSTGGDRPLLDSLSFIVKQPYQLIGIVLDTDTELTCRWQQIQDRLAQAGLNPPESPDQHGTIIQGISPHQKIGIWLMPNNMDPGKLEDFLKTLIPDNDKCWPYAKQATEQAKKLGANFKEIDTIKAEIHTWLAWQAEPGKPFGTALNAKYFEHDSPEALAFIAWFKRLFLDDEANL